MGRQPKKHKPIDATFQEVLQSIAHEQEVELVQFAKPFLKWVGGKRSVLPMLLERVPKNYSSYYELFLGGGALFFALKPKRAYLSDINFHLIITFQVVRDNIDLLISYLKKHEEKHSEVYYYKAREKLFTEKDNVRIAALFIYLNKTCFNGLYRVNNQGKFNVPIGDYKKPNILDEENLRACSKLLRGIEIKQHDYSQVTPVKGAFFYLDPPYHMTYDGYNGRGFGDKEHKELAEYCRLIDRNGGYFMLSNSDTKLVRELYKGYTVESILATRSVSCKGTQRGKENEVIIRNYK